MSKKHHWAKTGGCPLHLDTRAPTENEETTAAVFFADGQPLNRAMRRHQARYLRKLAKRKGKQWAGKA